VAIALANVASQYLDKKDYASAEPIFRDVIRRLTEVLPPDNVNTGIARIKLGRTLLQQNRSPKLKRKPMRASTVSRSRWIRR
jgi:eukaryotic-like serine/threonine-protein kinase